MSGNKNRLHKFVLGGERMDHCVGHLESKKGISFFSISFDSFPRSRLDEATADFYVSSDLSYQKVHCYFPGKAKDNFPVLVTDSKFNALYIGKGYMDRIDVLD